MNCHFSDRDRDNGFVVLRHRPRITKATTHKEGQMADFKFEDTNQPEGFSWDKFKIVVTEDKA